jgi:hypothetical protein
MRKAWERFVQSMARPKWRWVMLVAVLSDVLSFGLDGVLGLFSLGVSDLVEIPVDLVTAGIMIAVLGFRWTLAIPLVAEAIPGLAVFPTWTLAVGFYAATDPQEPEAPPGLKPQ